MLLSIKETPVDERPYEKCLKAGCESLSDAELLAVIIRTGTKEESCLALARRVLNHSLVGEGLLGLCHLSVPELTTIPGIGPVKAVQLKCVAELSRRIYKRSVKERLSFTSPKTVAGYFMEDMRHKEQEELLLLMFNTKNCLLKITQLSKGTVNASVITPREIFIEAFKHHAVYIILMHNHPSGDPTPSSNDLALTKRIKEAGEIVGILLIDHIIIGDQSYISLKEQGVL